MISGQFKKLYFFRIVSYLNRVCSPGCIPCKLYAGDTPTLTIDSIVICQTPRRRSPNFCAWAYGKEKIRGAEKNLPDFFGFCPTSPENFFGQQINFGDPPPSPKKFRTVYHFRCPKNFPDILNFSEHQTRF